MKLLRYGNNLVIIITIIIGVPWGNKIKFLAAQSKRGN